MVNTHLNIDETIHTKLSAYKAQFRDDTGVNHSFSDVLDILNEEYEHSGDKDDTISFVLGVNQNKGTLTNAGIKLCAFLSKLEKDLNE